MRNIIVRITCTCAYALLHWRYSYHTVLSARVLIHVHRMHVYICTSLLAVLMSQDRHNPHQRALLPARLRTTTCVGTPHTLRFWCDVPKKISVHTIANGVTIAKSKLALKSTRDISAILNVTGHDLTICTLDLETQWVP
jgi:hypothetical protein